MQLKRDTNISRRFIQEVLVAMLQGDMRKPLEKMRKKAIALGAAHAIAARAAPAAASGSAAAPATASAAGLSERGQNEKEAKAMLGNEIAKVCGSILESLPPNQESRVNEVVHGACTALWTSVGDAISRLCDAEAEIWGQRLKAKSEQLETTRRAAAGIPKDIGLASPIPYPSLY